MLNLYRQALAGRAAEPALGDGPMQWLDSAPNVLAFTRGENFTCVVNLSDTPVQLPDHAQVLVSSQPLSQTVLPSDTSVWLRTTA